MPVPNDTFVTYEALPPFRVVKRRVPDASAPDGFAESELMVTPAVRISITGNGLLSKAPQSWRLVDMGGPAIMAQYHIGRLISETPFPGGPDWKGEAAVSELIYRAGTRNKKRLLIPVRTVSGPSGYMPLFDQTPGAGYTAGAAFSWEGYADTWENGWWDKAPAFVQLLEGPGRLSDEYICPSNAVADLTAGADWLPDGQGGLLVVGDDGKSRRLISILGKPYVFADLATMGRWVGAVRERAEVRGRVDRAALASRVRSMEAKLLTYPYPQVEFAIRDEIDYCESFIE